MPNTKVRSFWVLCLMPREFWSFLDWLLGYCRHYCLLSTITRYYYLSPFPQPLKFPHMCALISTLLYTQGRSSAGIWSSLSLFLSLSAAFFSPVLSAANSSQFGLLDTQLHHLNSGSPWRDAWVTPPCSLPRNSFKAMHCGNQRTHLAYFQSLGNHCSFDHV